MSKKSLIKIPSLRLGQTFLSRDPDILRDCRTGEPFAELSCVADQSLRDDLAKLRSRDEIFARHPTDVLHRAMRNAGDFFLNGALPLHDGPGESAILQKPAEYVDCLSASSGLPPAQVRSAMEELAGFLTRLPEFAPFLMNDLPMTAFDGAAILGPWGSEFLAAREPYAMLALNGRHPSENIRWLHALALRLPVAVKAHPLDPWTPLRLAQALISAGVPPEAVHVSCAAKSDCSRDEAPSISRKSPLLVFEDSLENWSENLALMESFVTRHAGRSPLSTGLILTPRRAEDVAYGLAQRLTKIPHEPWSAPNAQIPALPDCLEPVGWVEKLDEFLRKSGARDVTASIRKSTTLVEHEGFKLLLPTVLLLSEEPAEIPDVPDFPFPCVLVMPIAESRAANIGRLEQIEQAILLTSRQETLEKFARAPGLRCIRSATAGFADSELLFFCRKTLCQEFFDRQIVF